MPWLHKNLSTSTTEHNTHSIKVLPALHNTYSILAVIRIRKFDTESSFPKISLPFQIVMLAYIFVVIYEYYGRYGASRAGNIVTV